MVDLFIFGKEERKKENKHLDDGGLVLSSGRKKERKKINTLMMVDLFYLREGRKKERK